jgi:ADP-heptose:LPS heptosyltransferase
LIPADGPVLAVGPTANWGGKQWPAERFAEIIARLTADGAILERARAAVFGAADERPAAAPVIESLPPERRIDLVGEVDLLTAAACLERCALYIGNDSGLMHLAAAAGTPTLGLFGPSKETLYAPWGAHTAVARTALSFDEIVSAPDYDYLSHESHMASLDVETVEQAAVGLWRRSHGDDR